MDRYVTTRRPRSISRSCDRLASSPVRVRSAEPQLASAATALPSRNGRDRLVARIGPCSAVAGAARPDGRARRKSWRRSGRAWPPRAGVPGCSRCGTRTASGRAGRVSRRTSAVTSSQLDSRGHRPCRRLTLLRDFGVDPTRRAGARDGRAGAGELPLGARRAAVLRLARSSHASTAGPSRIGAYFGRRRRDIVRRLLGEQLADGGWNCEAENGLGSLVVRIPRSACSEGLLAHERATGGSPRRRSRRAGAARSTCSTGRLVPAQEHRRGRGPDVAAVLVSDAAGTTTCCARLTTSGAPVTARTRALAEAVDAAAVEAAAGRHLVAGEHPPWCGALPTGERRRNAQPLEHATGVAGAGLVRRQPLTGARTHRSKRPSTGRPDQEQLDRSRRSRMRSRAVDIERPGNRAATRI